MDLDPYALRMGVIRFFVIFCSLILQQCGRAFIAHRLGDDTPRNEGRLTLNPVSHIDPFGTILLPLLASFGLLGPIPFIGWAKALNLNPGNFHQRKFGEVLIILAGPGLFFLLALAGSLGAVLVARAGLPVFELFVMVIQLNVALGVFNLLPIPPIEISKFYVFLGLMREETHAKLSLYGGFVLLFLLIAVPPFQQFVFNLINLATLPFAWLITILGPK